MNQTIISNLLSWKMVMEFARLLVYVTPFFVLLDVLCVRMARSRKIVLKSLYFKYHEKNYLITTPVFKLFFWCLLFLYVQYALVQKPFIIVIGLMLYFVTVVKQTIQIYNQNLWGKKNRGGTGKY